MNSDLKRYKRLYKLTGDPAWIAKYAEEENRRDDLPIKLPTVKTFTNHLVRGNDVEFEGNVSQGILGGVAANVLGAFYLKKLDHDEDAIVDIELKEDLSDALAPSLLSFSRDEYRDIKKQIRSDIAKLGDLDLSEKAKTFADEQIGDLIRFALIRGYIRAYWAFIFNNPLISLVLENRTSKSSAPLSIKSYLKREAATVRRRKKDDPKAKTKTKKENILDQVFEEMDAGVIGVEEEEKAQQELKGFLAKKGEKVKLSTLLKAMKVLRVKKAKVAVEQDDNYARMDYLAIDGNIKYLEKIQQSIKFYLEADERNKFRKFLGQPIAGADGKGDIWIAAMGEDWPTWDSINIPSILSASYGDIRIPFKDAEGNDLEFGTGEGAVGKVMPSARTLYDIHIQNKYQDIESYKQEMKEDLFGDQKIAFQSFLENNREKGFFSGGSDHVVSNMILKPPASPEDKRRIWGAINAVFNWLFDRDSATWSDNFTQGSVYKTMTDGIRQYIHPESLLEGWEQMVKVLISQVIKEVGLVSDLNDVSERFNKPLNETLLDPKTVSVRKGKVTDPIDAPLSLHDPADQEALKQAIKQMIRTEMPKADEELGYKGGAVEFRDAAKYRDYFLGKESPIKRRLEAEWLAKLAGMPDVDDWSQFNQGDLSKRAVLASNSIKDKKSKESISKLIEIIGRGIYPDAFEKKVGSNFFEGYMKQAGGYTKLSEPNRSALNRAVLDDVISPEALQKLEEFLKNNPIPMYPGESLWDKLDENLATYLQTKLPAPLITALKSNFRGRKNFGRVAAKELKEILGSPAFVSETANWQPEYENALKQADRKTFLQSQSDLIKSIYNMLSQSEALKHYLPKPTDAEIESGKKRYPLIQDAGNVKTKDGQDIKVNNESISINSINQVRQDAWANVLAYKRWMAKHRLSQEELNVGVDPDIKVRELIVQILGEEYRHSREAVQALYVYLGTQLMVYLNSLPPPHRMIDPNNKEEKYEDAIVHYIRKKYIAPRQRGAGGAEAGFEEGEDVRDVAKKEADKFWTSAFEPEALFRTVFTRDTMQEKKLGLSRRRGLTGLDTHSFGGIVQQLMGHSLSPELGRNFKEKIKKGKELDEEPFELLNTLRRGMAMSFGDGINNKVMETLRGFWNGPNACFDNIEDMMEKTKAFAHPKYAFAPFTEVKALERLQKVRRETGAVIDDPDTAYDHLLRVAYWVDLPPNASCKQITDAYSERFRVIENDLAEKLGDQIGPDGKERILNSDLITHFKRDEDTSRASNRTNNPFKNWTPQNMERLLEHVGLSQESLGIYFQQVNKEKALKVLKGFDVYNDVVNEADLEERALRDDRNRSRIERLNQYVINSVGSANKMLRDLFFEANDGKLEVGGEILAPVLGSVRMAINNWISYELPENDPKIKENKLQVMRDVPASKGMIRVFNPEAEKEIFASAATFKLYMDPILNALVQQYPEAVKVVRERLQLFESNSEERESLSKKAFQEIQETNEFIKFKVGEAIQAKMKLEGRKLTPDELDAAVSESLYESDPEEEPDREEEEAEEVMEEVTPTTMVRRREPPPVPEEEAAEEVMEEVLEPTAPPPLPQEALPPTPPPLPLEGPTPPPLPVEVRRQPVVERVMRRPPTPPPPEEDENQAYDVGVFGANPNDEYTFSNLDVEDDDNQYYKLAF
jgi:hypothetical protein